MVFFSGQCESDLYNQYGLGKSHTDSFCTVWNRLKSFLKQGSIEERASVAYRRHLGSKG